jgi:hypothetical protein
MLLHSIIVATLNTTTTTTIDNMEGQLHKKYFIAEEKLIAKGLLPSTILPIIYVYIFYVERETYF